VRYKVILLLLLASATVFAAPVRREHQVSYQINGNTSQELREQMNSLGPFDHGKRYDAYTAWNIQWRYKYSDTQSGCKMEKVHVNLDITYTFPEWKNFAEANTELKEKWDKYLSNLRRHENTHAANGEEAAAEVEYVLQNFPVMQSCQTLQALANRRAQQIIMHMNERDVEYDKNTRHGITQGAVFP